MYVVTYPEKKRLSCNQIQ